MCKMRWKIMSGFLVAVGMSFACSTETEYGHKVYIAPDGMIYREGPIGHIHFIPPGEFSYPGYIAPSGMVYQEGPIGHIHTVPQSMESQEMIGGRIPTGHMDYSRSDISSIHSSFAKHFSVCLEEIKSTLTLLKESGRIIPIQISLAINYLQDDIVSEIYGLCSKDKYLRENFVSLDLSNNRLTNDSLPLLRQVVEMCPKLTIDVSINYFDASEVRKNLGDLISARRIIYHAF